MNFKKWFEHKHDHNWRLMGCTTGECVDSTPPESKVIKCKSCQIYNFYKCDCGKGLITNKYFRVEFNMPEHLFLEVGTLEGLCRRRPDSEVVRRFLVDLLPEKAIKNQIWWLHAD